MKKLKMKKLTADQRKISLLEAQLASAAWNIDQHHIKCNHLEMKVIDAEQAMKRAQEDSNRCRSRHGRLVEEIKTVRQFLSEVSPTDCSAVLLQRTIGIAQGHLAVIVEQNKPVFNKVSDYIREQERQKNRVMSDSVDALLNSTCAAGVSLTNGTTVTATSRHGMTATQKADTVKGSRYP